MSTIGSQIIAQCANSASRRYHGPGIDRYWRVKYGVYRLYEPDQLHESDQPYEFNQPVNLDNVLKKDKRNRKRIRHWRLYLPRRVFTS